jgi:hypothetical protein
MHVVQRLPSAEGSDFKWKDKTIATDTIAMYTLSFSHDKKANDLSVNTLNHTLIAAHFFRSLHGREHPRQHCRIATLQAVAFL